jgi:uncharacterized protein YjbI with pentapeptide repeats
MLLGILLAALVAPVPHFCAGCNFAAAQLADANFAGGVYVGANFAGAVLTGASFRGAELVAANFEGADLRGAAFDAARCTACNFQAARLDGATFSGVRMVAANFKGFAAAGPDAAIRDLLAGCVVCNFQAASLAGRDLSGVPLISIDLSQADLQNTKFDGAVLCWYVVDGTQRATKCDAMQGARVNGASFTGVRLCSDPTDPHSCVPVDAASLRRYASSPLSGAALP